MNTVNVIGLPRRGEAQSPGREELEEKGEKEGRRFAGFHTCDMSLRKCSSGRRLIGVHKEIPSFLFLHSKEERQKSCQNNCTRH